VAKPKCRQPCNHRNRYNMGKDHLLGDGGKITEVTVWWCHICGAVSFAGGWMYPRRSYMGARWQLKRRARG